MRGLLEGTVAGRDGELRKEFLRMPGGGCCQLARIDELLCEIDMPLGRWGISDCALAIDVGVIFRRVDERWKDCGRRRIPGDPQGWNLDKIFRPAVSSYLCRSARRRVS